MLSKWEDDEIILNDDNCLVIGKQNQIKNLIIELQSEGFNLKVTSSLTHSLSCCVIENASKREIMIAQPHLINNLIDKFEQKFHQLNVYKAKLIFGL